MNQLYIIAGCNGAGKTTASYTILPQMLDCKEFVNADEIARGMSPFQPEKIGLQAGRLMLARINQLLTEDRDFAFETTLSTRSYVGLVNRAKERNYFVTLLFFWLNSPDLAVRRVKIRVTEGGHAIPEDVIRRRYNNGLSNFFELYQSICDYWLMIDNSGEPYQIISEGKEGEIEINNAEIWNKLKTEYHGK